MGKVRCAVVGVGYLGRFHAQKYKMIESAELVGVADAQAERVHEVAGELGVKAFTDYRQLVGQVDAVTVAASTKAHFELAKFFLSNGIHVNVEKPMTSTVLEAEELVRIAKEKDLRLQVGHVERFNPALQAARSKLEMPLFIECHRLAPFKPRGVDVDVVLDLMIHDLDVILSLVKSPVKSVSAVGAPVLTQLVDIANARIEFESGTVANITSSRVSQNATRKFRVFQKSQYLSIDFGTGEVNLTTKTGEWEGESLPLEFESWSLEKGDALLAETQAFVDAIRDQKPCVVSGQDGLVAMALAERVREDIYQRLKSFR
ncbi:MAG: Gfo/Idh/MocA family oxidoreductase [Bdellovibrionaceae bacterium]|nr:Gfo/Idh/MocA family oxidoreductase [Pseudobdellovibrionaceae bacterium]